MKINLLVLVSSYKEQNKNNVSTLIKTIESTIRPVEGDIIDDPGFDPGFHNGYKVVKVTLNYASNTCWVSLSPLEIEAEEISVQSYVNKLEKNGWKVVTKEELLNM
ncbi:hypothetical protein ACFSCX_13015 [Bacillus salitolerans]|uniref:Uncharacterized protein n=1 Tax=Bacillus salitolerans TaxID=1437434 RepID=A0ABW4LQQ1_9BACI